MTAKERVDAVTKCWTAVVMRPGDDVEHPKLGDLTLGGGFMAEVRGGLANAIREAEQAMKERCIAVMKETCAADCNDEIFPRSLEEAERLMRALE